MGQSNPAPRQEWRTAAELSDEVDYYKRWASAYLTAMAVLVVVIIMFIFAVEDRQTQCAERGMAYSLRMDACFNPAQPRAATRYQALNDPQVYHAR